MNQYRNLPAIMPLIERGYLPFFNITDFIVENYTIDCGIEAIENNRAVVALTLENKSEVDAITGVGPIVVVNKSKDLLPGEIFIYTAPSFKTFDCSQYELFFKFPTGTEDFETKCEYVLQFIPVDLILRYAKTV